MGKGVALAAAVVYPSLPRELGGLIRSTGSHTYAFPLYHLATIPTKHHWKSPSDFNLIKQSLAELSVVIDTLELPIFYLPPLGCGNGGLNWFDIKDYLSHMLHPNIRIVLRRPEYLESLSKVEIPNLTPMPF